MFYIGKVFVIVKTDLHKIMHKSHCFGMKVKDELKPSIIRSV